MKRLVKYLALLILLSGVSVFGVIQYLHSKNRGQATEEAADAIAGAANAAIDWARDKTPRQVDVIAYFGEGQVGRHAGIFAVRATLTAIGAARLSEVCAGMPQVRDAMNTVLFDSVHGALESRHALDDATLAGYAPRLADEINRSFGGLVVSAVKLGRAAPSVLADAGCKSGRTASRR